MVGKRTDTKSSLSTAKPNIKNFAKYQEALEPGGLIITDSLGFHNLVGNDEKKPKRIKNW